MGNYWEPIEQEFAANVDTINPEYLQQSQRSGPYQQDDRGDISPISLRGQHEADEQSERRGGDVSQYGGPGRPTGSGDYGGDDPGYRGDDDRYTQPFSEQGGPDQYDSERTPFGYQPEERYWTDYLRIAAPVVGVILMLGLVWFWVAQMLGNDDENGVSDDQDTSGPVIESDTPESTAPEDDEADEAPIGIATPGDDDPDAENGEETEAPTTIGPGATVVVVGTGEAGLNVRASASANAEVVSSVPDGTTMTITGESQEADNFTWWPVESGDITGFVAADFIELSTE